MRSAVPRCTFGSLNSTEVHCTCTDRGASVGVDASRAMLRRRGSLAFFVAVACTSSASVEDAGDVQRVLTDPVGLRLVSPTSLLGLQHPQYDGAVQQRNRRTTGRQPLNHSHFSFYEAQTSLRRCMGGSTPEPRADAFAYFASTSALGNTLNIWMHAFLYALASGRQPVMGKGITPDLMCGPEGVFVCGVPYRGTAWLKERTSRGVDGDWSESDHDVHVVPVGWYSYKHLDGSLLKGSKDPLAKERKTQLVSCFIEALRCPRGKSPRNGLDHESCAMVRAMQMLFPGWEKGDVF